MNDNASFASAVKSGKIKQPTQIGFSEKKWTKAFRFFKNVSKEDEKLYFEGLWFYNYLSDIR